MFMNVILGILHSVLHRVIVSFDASYIDKRIELSNERKIEKENRNICKSKIPCVYCYWKTKIWVHSQSSLK